MGAEPIAGRGFGVIDFRPEEGAVGHAKGLEDVFVQIILKGCSGYVLDKLPQRRRAVVAVPEPGTRLCIQPQGPSVVPGQGWHWPHPHALPIIPAQHPGARHPLGDTGSVGSRCRIVADRQLAFAGTSWYARR